MATSGTVGTTVFNTRKLIDHAYARCKIKRQKVTAERIVTAQELLFLRLSSMANKGIPLWAVQREILPLYVSEQSVPTPVGSVDVLNLNLRRTTRVTDDDTIVSSSAGTAENAFDGDFDTECAAGANGYIQAQFGSEIRVEMFGILPGVSGTWSYEIQVSADGVTFTTIYTATAETVTDQEWIWFDVEGVLDWEYYRLQATGGTVLTVAEWVLANTPNEIPIAPLNRDDYSSMPDKTFLSQPTSFWEDRQRAKPMIMLWPTPNEQCRFWNLTAYVHRQVMDVGSMVQEVEVRQSDYLAIVCRLAADIGMQDEEADPNWVQNVLIPEAEKEWAAMWDGESDDAPATITPNIRPYTR